MVQRRSMGDRLHLRLLGDGVTECHIRTLRYVVTACVRQREIVGIMFLSFPLICVEVAVRSGVHTVYIAEGPLERRHTG